MGRHVVWAETAPAGVTALFVATDDGVAVEAIPAIADHGCEAEAVTVDREGLVHVAGACSGKRAPGRGFIAVRRAARWSVVFRRYAIGALGSAGPAGGLLAIEGWKLLQCDGRLRCGVVGRAPQRLVAISGAGVIGVDGSVYEIGGLGPVVESPGYALDISQVIEGRGGIVALFGPVIRGSEHHPFCVRSVVARLTAKGWVPLHRVEDRESRLSGGFACLDDDSRFVVTDIAVAETTVYARRRFRRRGESVAFEELVELGPP